MKRQLLKHILALMMVAVMVITAGGLGTAVRAVDSVGQPNVELNEYGLTVDVEDGTILHTWCWSYATVKENIPEIAAAGFSAIQVSPISLCKVGGTKINGGWYWHYQPVNYEVFGNYQMGTLDDFKAMCDEAHSYGLKVIVDTVINHCTSDYGAIDESITGGFDGQAFHDHSEHDHPSASWSENDRYEETQYPLSGLYDWNTQRQDVQDYLKTFLEKCVEYGADGFRYDAAKLIELPDDTSAKYGDEFSSDFWPYVLENGASFQYGESLQEGGAHEYNKGADAASGYNDQDTSRLSAYQALEFTTPDGEKQGFFTTASYYGFRVRDCVSNGNMDADYVGDFLMPEGATIHQTVTWVESHDNYCNNSSYKDLNDQQVIQAWAIIAARAGGTPLFYSRPNNSSASKPWGDDVIGPAGSDMYKDPQVVAVNFFGNEMGDDAPEYLSNPMGNSAVLMIERGTADFAGSVIINTSDEDIVLQDVAVNAMADGTYTDAAYGGTFVVEGGKLSGTVKAGMVAVVYNSTIDEDDKVDFAADVELSQATQDFLTETISVTINIRGCASAAYQINDGEIVACSNGTTLTFGMDMVADEAVTLKVMGYDADGNVAAQTQATYTKRVAHGQTIAYFDARAYEGWDDIYVYAYANNGNNGGWPGVRPENLGNGLYRYVLPFELESAAGLHVMWTNNGTKTEGKAELPMDPRTSMIYKADRTWVPYEGTLACVGLSKPSGDVKTNFAVTVTAIDCVEVSYTINGGAAVVCENGTVIDIDVDALEYGQSITLKLNAKDADGNDYSAEAVYTKPEYQAGTKAYLDSALYPDWENYYIYVTGTVDGKTVENAPSPGVPMTDEGNGIYSYVIPYELESVRTNIYFNNGDEGDAYVQHARVRLQSGAVYMLDAEGTWAAYDPDDPDAEPVIRKVYFDIGAHPDWTEVYVYLWATGVTEYAPWPGVPMTDEGNGLYSFVIPAELDGNTMNVIFNNNAGTQHADVPSEPGTQMILTADGQWIPYVPADPDVPDVPEDPDDPDVPDVPENPDTPDDPDEPVPGTGDPALWMLMGVLLVACGAISVMMTKRRYIR